MAIFDIFDDDAFGLVSMSEAIERRPYVPQGLANMNIFNTVNIRTEDIAIEMGSSKLNLIATSNRGEPLEQLGKRDRNIRKYSTTRIGQGSRIMASELDFLRSMGTEQGIQTLTQELADRLGHGNNIGILDNIDATLEHMMLGAVQGKVIDKDGTVIIDWAKELDGAVDQGGNGSIASIAWNLSATDGAFRKQCNNVRRDIVQSSGGAVTERSIIMNLCGSDLFDQVCMVKEVREQYLNQQNKAMYVDGGGAYEQVEYPAGTIWKHYRGTDDNSTVAIASGECVTFPIGTKGGFLEVFAHGETFDQLGTKGKRFYAHVLRSRDDTYVDLKAMSYPLLVCTIPKSLRKGTIA